MQKEFRFERKVVGKPKYDGEQRMIQRKKAGNLMTRLCFSSFPLMFGTQMTMVNQQRIYDVMKPRGWRKVKCPGIANRSAALTD